MPNAPRLWLLAGVLLVTAATSPPPPADLPPREHSLTLTGKSLTITPENDIVHLRFTGGAQASGPEFSLSADDVEIDVDAAQVWQGEKPNIPEMPEDYEHITREPGQTINQMSNELTIPTGSFTESGLRRVGAKGNVRVEGAGGLVLITEELISVDGGRSWAANQRSQLWRDEANGDHAEMSADFLVLDILEEATRALARGNIKATLIQGGSEQAGAKPVRFDFEAQRCQMDLKAQTLRVSEGLTANFKDLQLCCGTLFADLNTQNLNATGTPRLQDLISGTTLNADSISIDVKRRSAVASGNVRVNYEKHGINLSAGRITVDLKDKQRDFKAIATEEPVLRYGGSTYSGEQITVTVVEAGPDSTEKDQVVFEVTGEQEIKLNLDEISAATKSDTGE